MLSYERCITHSEEIDRARSAHSALQKRHVQLNAVIMVCRAHTCARRWPRLAPWPPMHAPCPGNRTNRLPKSRCWRRWTALPNSDPGAVSLDRSLVQYESNRPWYPVGFRRFHRQTATLPRTSRAEQRAEIIAPQRPCEGNEYEIMGFHQQVALGQELPLVLLDHSLDAAF